MNSSLNPPDEKLCEQLCAYMDGELSADAARFLERRLANEPALQAKWQRLQLASACLKGQPFQPMTIDLCARVAAALAVPAVVADVRRPWRLWATAASIALLTLAFAPRLFHSGSGAADVVAPQPMAIAPVSTTPAASPSSADLVAATATPIAAMPSQPAIPRTTAAPRLITPRVAAGGTADDQAIAVSAESPTDFPLVETGASKSWPRSELPGAANDPSIEAYLVRHNQMLANDGLGGFVPYVDVVTNTGDRQ